MEAIKKVKLLNLSWVLGVLMLASSVVIAEPVKLSEDLSSAGFLSVPISCGDRTQLLTGVALPYQDDTEKVGQKSLFPISLRDGLELEDFSTLKADMSKKGTFEAFDFGGADLSPEEIAESDGGKFIDLSLKEINYLNEENLVQKGFEEKLARMALKNSGLDFDTASESNRKAALEYASRTVKGVESGNFSDKIKPKIDCGNGRVFETELVYMNLASFRLDENDKMVRTMKSVLCKPEDAGSDASCLAAYRKALQDFKNSGKPMFAFSGPSQNGNVAGGTPSPSTLSRHAESASPGSPQRPYTSNHTSGSRGMKQAGAGGSHFKRN